MQIVKEFLSKLVVKVKELWRGFPYIPVKNLLITSHPAIKSKKTAIKFIQCFFVTIPIIRRMTAMIMVTRIGVVIKIRLSSSFCDYTYCSRGMERKQFKEE